MADEKKKAALIEHPNVYAALSAFQGELKPIARTSKVKFKTKAGAVVDFTYAPLEKIMEAIYPILGKHGLSVHHELGENSVECFLFHASSEEKRVKVVNSVEGKKVGTDRDIKEAYDLTIEKEARIEVIPVNIIRSGKLSLKSKDDMKEVGGQITYARRYTIGLVLGIATEEDKDAELFDKSRANTAQFAFNTVKKGIEAANKDQLKEKLDVLTKDLKLAKAIKDGKGTRAPALGLSVEQYEELIKTVKARQSEGEKK